MDTPRVALRFKDVVTDIDTIEEHQRMITTEGAVWWGWWKKEKGAALFRHQTCESGNEAQEGLAAFARRSCRRGDLSVGVEGLVVALEFASTVKRPVLVEVAAGLEGA